jgi:hypothetical protein
MKTHKFTYAALFASLFLFFFSNKALAKEEEDPSGFGYTVSAVLNSKQIDPEVSYFYIQTTPNEEQQLKVKVQSTQKEPVKIKVYTTNAITAGNGRIEYTDDAKLLDTSLTVTMSSLLEVETPSITVENFEEKEAVFKLKPPAENYEGVKMGALVFELDDSEGKGAVSNKFAYRVGIITSENGDDYRDSKTLNLLEAKSTLLRGKKVVLSTLQNNEPKILSNLEINAEVKEKGSNKVLKKKKVNDYSLAPNSHLDFEIDWGTAAVKAGTYTLVMNANNGYSEWAFEKEFTITGEQAKKMNEESGFKIITPFWIKVVAILSFVLLGVVLLLLRARRNKFEAEWKKRRKRKKRKKKGAK